MPPGPGALYGVNVSDEPSYGLHFPPCCNKRPPYFLSGFCWNSSLVPGGRFTRLPVTELLGLPLWHLEQSAGKCIINVVILPRYANMAKKGPIVDALGVPELLHQLMPSKQFFDEYVPSTPSTLLKLLSLDCDADSATSGKALNESKTDITLARVDLVCLDSKRVEAIHAFLMHELADLVAYGELGADARLNERRAAKRSVKEAVERIISHNFAAFFTSYKEQKAASVQRWLTAWPPDETGPPFCDNECCEARAGPQGQPLQFCGGCK